MKLAPKWQSLIIISIGIFMATLDGSILNIANPTIAEALQTDMQQVQWIVTVYMLVITASLIFFGRLGDRLGNERVYATGFLIFALGSFLCSLSASLPFLIACRVVQAMGASMMMATGMGIISNTFPDGERGKALGLTGMIVGLGNMTGPGLGGFLVTQFTWPVLFLINVPIGLLGFWLGMRFLPKQQFNPNLSGHDWLGTIVFALLTGLLIYSVAHASAWIGLVLLLIPLFCWMENRSVHPLLDFTLFKIKNFSYGMVMASGIYITQMTVLFLLPFFLEEVFHLNPSRSGLLITVTPICMAITAPLAGTLSDKVGSRKILSLSLFIVTGAFLVLTTLKAQFEPGRTIAGLALLGIGMGMFGSPNNSSIFSSVPKEKAGYVGGFIATVRNLSFALGTAGSVSVFYFVLALGQKSMSYNQAYIHASNTVYLLAAAITGAGFIFSLLGRWGGNPADDQTQVDCENSCKLSCKNSFPNA
ncbi:MAG TPA: MFS transporter [Syntrophomonas sp.]|nr:MFS transporter [Syntrophomonas sp.]